MADLTVVATLTAQEGQEGRLREALIAIVDPTRAEDGCLSYELFESQSAPSTFITIEKWRSQQDLDAHMTTPHLKRLEGVADAMVGTPAIHPLTPLGT